MTYKLTQSGSIIRIADGACIPVDLRNTDYQEYQRWLEGGNTPAPADAPTHAEMVTATMTQARQQRLPIMSILDGLQSSAITTGDMPMAQAIETAKQGLRDITTPDLSACTTQADMELAIFQAYQAIAAAAPPSVQTAFQSLVP